jgi:hypothetical protein
MSVYYTCPKCGLDVGVGKEPNRAPSIHSGKPAIRLTCQNCDYTGPDQYHNPGSRPRKRTSSSRKPVPPFFGNAKLSKEADQLAQNSYDLQEPLNTRQRARRPAISAAQEQTLLSNSTSGSISNSARSLAPVEQVDSVGQTESQAKESIDTRSSKERIFSLSLEEQRRFGYNAIGSGMLAPFDNESLTQSIDDTIQIPELFSWENSPSTTVKNFTHLRERTFDTKQINDDRLTAQNLGRLQKSCSDDKTNLVPEVLKFPSKTNALSSSIPPVGLKRVRSTRLERHPTPETEPLYLPHPSGPYLNPRRNTSIQQAAQRSHTPRAGRRPTVQIEQLRAFSTSNPGSAAAQMQALEASAAMKHVQSSKRSVADSYVPEPTAATTESITATALIQTVPPSQELAQLSSVPRGPYQASNCPITQPHPEGVYGVEGRRFYSADTTKVVPPEVVAAKTRIALLESGEEFGRYLEDVGLVRAFEDVHVSGSSRQG